MIISTPSFNLATYAKGDPKAEKLALVLPGRLDTKDYPHMRSHVDFLATQGYYAVSFDPPGTWESPGGIELYTMTNYLKAMKELIQHFDNRSTLLIGHSRGGSMAVLGGTLLPEVVAFIDIMGRASAAKPDEGWRTAGFKLEKRDNPHNPTEIFEYKLPYSFVEDSIQYSSIPQLHTCAKWKLFIKGSRDITMPPEFIDEAFDVSMDPKQMRVIESDHDYRQHPQLIYQVNGLIGDFLGWSKI